MNKLYSEVSNPETTPRGSASYVQATLQERLQNDINRLFNDEAAVTAQLQARTRQVDNRRLDPLGALFQVAQWVKYKTGSSEMVEILGSLLTMREPLYPMRRAQTKSAQRIKNVKLDVNFSG